MNDAMALEQRLVRGALAVSASRAVTMALALVGVPLLLAGLGREGFGAWAVLIGGVAFLGVLELGAGPTLIRFLAVPMRRRDRQATDRIVSSGMLPLLLLYAAGLAGLWGAAPALSRWLELPSTELLTPAGLLRVSALGFCLHGLVALLLTPLQAAERFVLASAITLGGVSLGQITAWAFALATGRLDLVLIGYWAARCLVTTAGALWCALYALPFRIRLRLVNRKDVAALFRHGGWLQLSQVCEIVNYQFDKLIIPGRVSMAAVSSYEVASRALLGLRGFPLSATTVLLPEVSSRHAGGREFAHLLVGMSRAASLSMLAFLLAPLALAPILFVAWAGETGRHAVPIFAILLPGTAVNILTAPVSTMLQSMGRTGAQAVAATVQLVANVVLSLLLIGPFGVPGAAAGTSLAMTATGLLYIVWFNRLIGASPLDTFGAMLSAGLPLLPVLVLIGGLAQIAVRVLPDSRWLLLAVGMLLGLAFVAGAIGSLRLASSLTAFERRTLARLPVAGRWFR